MLADITPPPEPLPYKPIPEILRLDMETLMRELPELKYGALGEVPVLYWDEELLRFILFPEINDRSLTSLTRENLPYPLPHSRLLLMYVLKMAGEESTIIGVPCIEPGRAVATVIVKERRPPEVIPIFLTRYYSESYALYIFAKEVINGTAERIAMLNICRCLFKRPTGKRVTSIEFALISGIIRKKTRIPKDIINKAWSMGYCESLYLREFLESPMHGLSIEQIEKWNRNPNRYFQNLFIANFINEKIDLYYPYISMKDIVESGLNKQYMPTYLEWFLRYTIDRTSSVIFKKIGEILVKYRVGRISRKEASEGIRLLFKNLLKIEVEDSQVEIFLKMPVTYILLESTKAGMINRILTELYELPVHRLEELYLSYNDLLAKELSSAIQLFVYHFKLDTLEVLKEKFGFAYKIETQKL